MKEVGVWQTSEMWKGVDLLNAPGHLTYFWHFTSGWDVMRTRLRDLDPLSSERTTHANTAAGLRTPSVATWDLERTRREFAFLNPTTGPAFDVPHLQATGQWLDLTRGRLLLLQPTTRASPVMQYLFVRGEGVMAQRLIETRSGNVSPRTQDWSVAPYCCRPASHTAWRWSCSHLANNRESGIRASIGPFV